jgi:hypothetical protein
MDRFRALPVPHNPQTDAERYLSMVHTSSQHIPDILTMAFPPKPSPLILLQDGYPPPSASFDDETMAAQILASFIATREKIAALTLQVAKGSSLPLSSQHIHQRLAHCGDTAWRHVCFGALQHDDEVVQEEDTGDYFEVDNVQGGEEVKPNTTQVWYAEEEEEEEEDCKFSTAIPPMMSYLVGLDQVSITRALTQMVRHLDKEKSFTISPSEAAWIFSLLAALQTPILDCTTATLRQLYILMQPHIVSNASTCKGSALILGVVTGSFFGQRD